MTEEHNELPEINLKPAAELAAMPNVTVEKELPRMQPVEHAAEKVVNVATPEHIHVYIKFSLMESIKTGYQRHFVFDDMSTRVKPGDVIKFQIPDAPTYITKRVGAVEYFNVRSEGTTIVTGCTIVTLLDHKEKGFAQPFQQTGDRYRAAFFSRNQGR